MSRRWIPIIVVTLLGACAAEPGELAIGADAGVVDAEPDPPAFSEATDDEISAFCQKTLTQVTDLDWLGEQLGVQGEVLRAAWCNGLVAPNLAQVEADRLSVCEQRVSDCLQASQMVFSVLPEAFADCESVLGDAREAGCMNPVTDFRDCLADSYPVGFSLGLTREQLQALADATCEQLIASPPPRGEALEGPPNSCIELQNACGAFRF